MPSSYQTKEQFFATRYKQGQRTVYGLNLTPDQLTSLVARPDPSVGTPGNRRIRPSHAQGFARYFIENDNWVAPGIILRAPAIFEFATDGMPALPDIEFGLMGYSKRHQGDIHILDGQHRILGFFLALDVLNDDIDKARSKRAAAKRTGLDAKGVAMFDKEIRELEAARDRFYTNRLAVEVHVTKSTTEARQLFFDIADNALGITASTKARFDSTKAVNRALAIVLEADNALLKNHVEMDQDRVQRNSPYLLSARQVVEIVRVLTVGFDGRISRYQNATLNEEQVAREALEFFSMLTEQLPPLNAYAHSQITAATLRDTMLLGNPLFLRVLAGVQYELVTHHAWTKPKVAEFIGKLAKHTVNRAHENSIWRLHAPETAFNPNAAGPNGRRADSNALVKAISEWAIDGAPFVDADALPAPVEPEPEVDPDEGIDFAPDHSTRALDREEREAIEEISKASKARAKAVATK
nr:DNA sulfur modification protein DndB [Microbacterium marinum]